LNISIVIAVNKRDFWFCRICVASIRYYYPHVPIYLLKDELNGKFSTDEIEKCWNVQLILYPMREFGWSAAKIHFYCDERFRGQSFLVLDADIVLCGRLLDHSYVVDFKDDVIVSEETFFDPATQSFTKTYFDYEAVKKYDKNYVFQGYTFNCGQLFCKGSFLHKNVLEKYFDFTKLPAWKMIELFPMVDQSLFNYLLPNLSRKGQIKLGRQNYMMWSETDTVRRIELTEVKLGYNYPYLIHWAGAFRTPFLSKMTGSSLLIFFENYYYKHVTLGFLKKYLRKCIPVLVYYVRFVLSLIKQAIK
jgi:hypothetical protein